MQVYILKQCSMGFRNKLSNLRKYVSRDKGSTTCYSYDHMTDECRSARNTISTARKHYLETIRSATNGHIDDFEVLEEVFNDETKKYKYPFENLVLKGGGMKGIAYCGLIKVLEEHGILQQMKRFAGTSAGAFTSALLAVGYNSYETEIILGVDFDNLVNDSSKLMYLPNLFCGYGFNTGKRFDRFIGDLLALKTGNPDVTFEEVYVRFNKELCLVVFNVDASDEIYCHVKTTPEMPVRLAVRMSMSLPGVFQAVQHNNSYFVDGGLLCNYPVRCFDSWFLSMEMENAFFNKIQSLNDLQNIMSLENRFKKDKENKTTMGGMVNCDGINNFERKMFGTLPNTELARNYTDKKCYDREEKEEYKKTIKAMVEFVKILTHDNKDYNRVIDKKEFMAAFKKLSFTGEYKKLLFGDECDPETAWVAVDRYGRGELKFRDIICFIESTRVSMFKAFKYHERKNTSNILSFVAAMFLGLNKSTLQTFFKSKDVERSVRINTWHVQTTNFKLEEGDKHFLTKQGRGSTRKFLENFLKENKLEKLTEEEMKDIVIPTDITVDRRKLEKIIYL